MATPRSPRMEMRDVAIADADRAAGNVLKPGDHAQHGGLPTAGGTEEDDEFMIGNVQVEVLDHE